MSVVAETLVGYQAVEVRRNGEWADSSSAVSEPLE
jgi:hypothetical protein